MKMRTVTTSAITASKRRKDTARAPCMIRTALAAPSVRLAFSARRLIPIRMAAATEDLRMSMRTRIGRVASRSRYARRIRLRHIAMARILARARVMSSVHGATRGNKTMPSLPDHMASLGRSWGFLSPHARERPLKQKRITE